MQFVSFYICIGLKKEKRSKSECCAHMEGKINAWLPLEPIATELDSECCFSVSQQLSVYCSMTNQL